MVCEHILANRGAVLYRFNKSTVLHGHVATHFHQIRSQRVIFVGNPEGSIERRNNRALGSSFPAELLRHSSVCLYAFVEHSFWECGMVLPPVNVRPHSLIVDIRVTALWHTEQRSVRIL